MKSKSTDSVDVFINKEADLYNRYTFSEKDYIKNISTRINGEVIEYLINEIKTFPINNTLNINLIISNNIYIDIKFIEGIIKENITKDIVVINKTLRKTHFKSIIFSIVGMLLIGVTQIFQLIEKRYSLNEFIIVMSWVSMWKAVDLIFFERADLMKEKTKLLKIYFAKIFLK